MQKEILVYKKGSRKPKYSRFDNVASKQVVNLLNGTWKTIKGRNICPLLKEWRSERISLEGNKNPEIIQEIKNIEFVNLKFLVLIYNEIVSIQGICNIVTPNLQQIYLNNNLINSVKDLKKAHFPSLLALSIGEQQINEVSGLEKMHLPILKNILLEWMPHKEVGFYDIRWTMKLQTNRLMKLCKKQNNKAIKNNQRIKQNDLIQAIKRRYQKVETNPVLWDVQ